MARRLGENMQREWDREPAACDLWDALDTLKRDRAAGISLLERLAKAGSPLAMMYLGHAQVSGRNARDLASGEGWLIKSAQAGSVEGRLQLAMHYRRQKRWSEAEAALKALVDRQYAPAIYALGNFLYRGELGRRSVPEAIRYLEMAKAAGHLPSWGRLSWIYCKEHFGLRGRILSHWYCLARIPAVMRYVWTHPGSDRLRRG